MAEIKVEKKNNNNWIWIVLGLIVLGIIIYFVVLDEDAGTDDDGVEQIDSQEVGEVDTSKDWKMDGRAVTG
jgi:ABC-type cobalt transport system substrate-binding protein